jgi:hypothetical protein
MVEPQLADLGILIDSLEHAHVPPNSEALSKLGKSLANVFAVDQDEVAILILNSKAKSLKFVIPEKLATVGSIPLSSATALAARTARERRPELINNFSTSRHASVFEGVPLGRDPGQLIQKIMSAPILDGTHVAGVVQISRKGFSTSSAGPDFTQKELRALTTLSPMLERFLKLCLPG